jgi:hypothetical protein
LIFKFSENSRYIKLPKWQRNFYKLT